MVNSKTALSSLLEQLGQTGKERKAVYEQYKELRDFEIQLRYQLELALRESGLKSAKGKDFSATIVERPTIVVRHEQSVIEWLQQTPDIEADRYVGLKTTEFKSLAKSILEGTGEVIPGTEVEIRENLAIKSNKKG